MRSLYLKPVVIEKPLDFSDGKYESFHLERDGLNVKIVSDGISDRQKEIESQKHNAGLQNILKMQTIRSGSIDNAIKRNEEKKVFADVSKIPDSVGEQLIQIAHQQNQES